ncbi:MAG: UBP-type zinc finger domain-containing protein [Polyangiaceae bacterium]|nr:UBP-type zinc finger domain-containing protein [Polyangiaceae bacterium]
MLCRMKNGDSIDLSHPCGHVNQQTPRHTARPTPGCEDCLKIGGKWVHLRTCLSCGHVGCCDDSPNRHATAHFKKTMHPMITSAEVGEHWAYCYADDQFLSEA